MLLTKTPRGLFIRAVIQDRDMAACMGVPTERVNMLTFAFGSGLAGLAGAFLSHIVDGGASPGPRFFFYSFFSLLLGGGGGVCRTPGSSGGEVVFAPDL